MPFPLEGQSWMLNIPGSQEIRGREDLRAPNIIAYSILAKCCCSGVLPGLSHLTLTNLRPWVTSTSPVLLTPAYQKNLYLYSSLSLWAQEAVEAYPKLVFCVLLRSPLHPLLWIFSPVIQTQPRSQFLLVLLTSQRLWCGFIPIIYLSWPQSSLSVQAVIHLLLHTSNTETDFTV